MASISYWFLSPSVILAMLGKWKGSDRTRATPAFDWTSATVDVVIPARNEGASIALCLRSLFEQDFSTRKVIVVDDASTDGTAEQVRGFRERTGKDIELVVRTRTAGKTAALREQSRSSDADALLVLDADTVLVDRSYLGRAVEELFRNAGVASVCGEVMPLTRRRRRLLGSSEPKRLSRLGAILEWLTVIYRAALYVFLQRVLYDGHAKLVGSRLNPIGCAVLYRTERLRACFDFAEPRIGDNLSNSEDIFIGHFFTWKGYRNVQVTGVRCESIEPPAHRLPRQLYLWSSSFVQTLYYFKDLPLSPFKKVKNAVAGMFSSRQPQAPGADRRRIREQYRQPWGEGHTRRQGRPAGWLDLVSMLEKISYPLILVYLAVFHQRAALFTIGLEAVLASAAVLWAADAGQRLTSAGMMLAATPIRVFSLAVDLVAVGRCLVDVATGNRNWRK